MSPIWSHVLAVVCAYLLGSLSFSVLIVRVLLGIDLRTVGSGNAGATNVLRVAGKFPALVALLLDAGKGLAAVLVARALDAPPLVVALVGVAAVLGHMVPIFFGFRGGKGVATAAGTLGSLAPVPTFVALGLFVLIVAATRYVSLGSILVAVAHPLLMWILPALGWIAPYDRWLVAGAAAIGALIVLKHHQNIGRLLRGQEKRIGQRAEVSAVDATTAAAEGARRGD